MSRTLFVAIFAFVYASPYLLMLGNVKLLSSLTTLLGIPLLASAVLVAAAWFRGKEIGNRWLYLLPLIPGVATVISLAVTFVPGSHLADSARSGPGAGVATMLFVVLPIVGSVSFVANLACLIIGASGKSVAANNSLKADGPDGPRP